MWKPIPELDLSLEFIFEGGLVMKKIIIYHSLFGCETGCCGHVVELEDGDNSRSRFFFEHPYDGDFRKFAEELVRKEFGEKRIKDLDWDNCVIVDD